MIGVRVDVVSFVLVVIFVYQCNARVGFATYDEVKGKSYQVTYNSRSILINGAPSLFISGSVHPPRATVHEWDLILSTAKKNGLNMIEIYVFWNYHEQSEGTFNWDGNANLTLFIQKCAENNLFVNLRLGPYVCAEWDYGGIPAWLGLKEGIQFRTYNQIWMQYMERWFKQVVNLLLPLFAKNGGPIVLIQVENELSTSGSLGQQYIDWCGKMAADAVASAPIPILMCNGKSAANTINTCNGNDCTDFITKHGQNGRVLIDQPALWTENEGGFQVWGESPSHITSYFWGRSIDDIAFTILKWFARGGSHNNYYMYYGGNNFGRFSGSGVTTMYASDVNICPDTMPHEPKFSHLGLLHSYIAEYADVIAYDQPQLGKEVHLQYYDNSTGKWSNGTQQIAFIYKSTNGRSVVFIENQFSNYILTRYNNQQFTLPGFSTSIVDGSTLKQLYNTAIINPPSIHRVDTSLGQPFSWKIWKEPLSPPVSQFPVILGNSPAEQSSVTKDLTQYLWYQTNVTVTQTSSLALTIQSQSADAWLVFVDGVYKGTADDHNHNEVSVKQVINLGSIEEGTHSLHLLSENLGYDNGMNSGSVGKVKGIVGSISLGTTDITNGKWSMRPYLAGEVLQVYTPKGSQSVTWSSNLSQAGPITWFQTEFSLPTNIGPNEDLLLDATGLGRGHAYVNGFDIGRYWTLLMNDGSGNPTQRLYHIPADLVNVGQNVLTLAEIEGAPNPTKAGLILRKTVPAITSNFVYERGVIESCPM